MGGTLYGGGIASKSSGIIGNSPVRKAAIQWNLKVIYQRVDRLLVIEISQLQDMIYGSKKGRFPDSQIPIYIRNIDQPSLHIDEDVRSMRYLCLCSCIVKISDARSPVS